MRYLSKEMVYGLLFCVIGTLLFAGWIVLDQLVLKKRRVGKHEQWIEKLERLERDKVEADVKTEAETEDKENIPVDRPSDTAETAATDDSTPEQDK